MNTLVVDGDNLLTIGFYGLKNHFYKGKHIGGIFHFLNTLRRMFEIHNIEKICVFWDGKNSSIQRKQIYHQYKDKTGKKVRNEEEISAYNYQKNRVKQYLEEIYVRQTEFDDCESDDCIAFYVQNTPHEKKIIFSSDRDLTQLLDDNTKFYNPSHHILYKKGDTIEYDHENILIDNVKLIKMLCGDPSDNIYGIKNLGIKKLINLIPELKNEVLTLDDVKGRVNLLFESDKNNNTIKNILTGVTKMGVLGDEFFYINSKIVELKEPFLHNEAKMEILRLIHESLDKEGRSYKNTMKMMVEDGIFTLLPKTDDAWLKFLTPFLKLTRKEKNKNFLKR